MQRDGATSVPRLASSLPAESQFKLGLYSLVALSSSTDDESFDKCGSCLSGKMAQLCEDKEQATSSSLLTSLVFMVMSMCGNDEVFCIWKAFGRNTRDLDSFGEETDCSRISLQWLETASKIQRDAVTTKTKTASQDSKTASEYTTQPII
ncbi:hypothetical protein Tco_0621845 [Tanacetum coccineum]